MTQLMQGKEIQKEHESDRVCCHIHQGKIRSTSRATRPFQSSSQDFASASRTARYHARAKRRPKQHARRDTTTHEELPMCTKKCEPNGEEHTSVEKSVKLPPSQGKVFPVFRFDCPTADTSTEWLVQSEVFRPPRHASHTSHPAQRGVRRRCDGDSRASVAVREATIAIRQTEEEHVHET